MVDSIQATFTITQGEYTRAIREHYRSKVSLKRDILGGLLTVSIGLYFLLTTDESLAAWLLIVPGLSLLGIVALVLWILPTLLYRTQPKLRNEYRLHFDNSGIHFETTNIKAQLDWNCYHSWHGDKEFFVLYHGKRDLTVIPRRSMTADGADHFAALLERKIGLSHSR